LVVRRVNLESASARKNMTEPEPKTAGAREPKVIKRYTNRKLYDTVESRYVTLDEIAEMIKGGTEVKIIDNRSKEDLTSVTLAQIIFEEEKKQSQMPLALLREIIRHPGESFQAFLQKEVQPRVASIREEAEQRLDKLLGRDGAASPEAPAAGGEAGAPAANATGPELLKASQRAWEDFQRRVDERVRAAVEGLVGNLPAAARDLQQLMARLEALEKKIDELEKK
jgi:polyhydroxyalkanoate synthesis repressor PhaR